MLMLSYYVLHSTFSSFVFTVPVLQIIDLEESIVQLKEDLIHEREEAQLEKMKLKESVANTQKKVEEQRRTNVLKRR